MKLSRHWLWLLLLVPIAIGFARLRFDVEILNLLPDSSPVVQGLKLYQKNFSNSRELIITLKSPDAETTENAARSIAEKLRSATNLVTRVTWQPPWLEHPTQAAELVAFLWLNQSPEIFGQLTNRLTGENLTNTLLEAREQLATSLSPNAIAMRGYDPFNLMALPESVTGAPSFGDGQELFASSDGTFHIVFVESKHELKTYKDSIAWIAEIKKLVQQTTTSAPSVNIGFTGPPAFVAEIAGGMENDMAGPSLGTLAVIAILFYATHRRWLPLVWLIILLVVIFALTLAFGGLIFGTLNVVSLGFASILFGLAEDFGIVLYQESRSHPEFSVAEIRHEARAGIFWSAVTTSGAFFLLNLSGMPGLGQLGSLVAIGIIIAAVVMLYAFLPPVITAAKKSPADAPTSHPDPEGTENKSSETKSRKSVWVWTFAAFVILVFLCVKYGPGFDHSPEALRPRNSPAYAAVEQMQSALGKKQEPLWIMIPGVNESEVQRRLELAEATLHRAASNGTISSFTLPKSLWPVTENQNANRPIIEKLLTQKEIMRAAALAHGFTSNSFALTESLFKSWEKAASNTNVFWPTNEVSSWIFGKVTAHNENGFLLLGMVYPPTSKSKNEFQATEELLANWPAELRREGIILSSWSALGSAMFAVAQKDFPRVVFPILCLVLISLWLAFRSGKEVLFSLMMLTFSGLFLLLIMSLFGWSWSLMNLMAVPLLLGIGVDFGIHMQLSLRRHHGNQSLVRNSIGRALLLAGSTTVAGFGALIFSSNAGLASLGKICAVGIVCSMLTAVYLIPVWWRGAVGEKNGKQNSNPSRASIFYRSKLWRVGLALARNVPPRIAQIFCRAVANIYWLLNPTRREVVIQNLIIPLEGDRAKAVKAGKELFQQFAIKLVDLWRYESGIPVDDLFSELTGWENFLAAVNQKRGVLILTPHLGNWEFGAPLLAQRGFKLLVVTLDEPDDQLTKMRQAARARWGIETLVIGKDPFAFVEIIRRLEAGEIVALLIDRPSHSSTLAVQLFGRTFPASIAAAELARATGCVLLPGYMVRMKTGYAAHILPEISYERPALRGIEARQKLTREIIGVFKSPIRQHLNQWYHFVPIWPKPDASKES